MLLFSDSASSIDDPYLARAYSLARRGAGRTAPNPIVGCVLVADGVVVGEGFHARAGDAHAEVLALRDAGDRARGATAYVTLEPCNHRGKTPPCTEALIDAGVIGVVAGMRDPSPEASGGASRLADAGVEVDFADDPSPFAELNEGWLKRLAMGIPFVTAKVGCSLDGRMALSAGSRSDMTGSAGGRVTSAMRAASDAVMVGAATARIDDPVLTVRDAEGVPASHQPLRLVLTQSACPDPGLRLFSDATARTVVMAPDGVDCSALEEGPGIEVRRYNGGEGLRSALKELGDMGLNDVLVEPGSRLLTALWEEGLVDRLVCVTGGGMAGIEGTEMYHGVPDGEGSRLSHRARAEGARVFGDVSVVSWRLGQPLEIQ